MAKENKHLKRAQEGLPFVTVKYAQSLDGRIATATGDSQWISSPESLRFVHKLRSEHDAILAGIGTVLKDDPRLTTRLVKGRDPLRVIVDSRLRIPLKARVLSEGAARHTLIFATEKAARARALKLEGLGAQVLTVPAEPGQSNVSLAALLARLRERGIRSVVVEGGAKIITSLLEGRLVDRLVIIIAPKIIGRGTEAINELGIKRLSDAIRFSQFETRRLGPDIIFDGLLTRNRA
jgi:diaminohydroxyphosphoribosylaminopyrimidine deaminase / 5-amino-6-(5-phosphoribosylamino)uracil reductase